MKCKAMPRVGEGSLAPDSGTKALWERERVARLWPAAVASFPMGSTRGLSFLVPGGKRVRVCLHE